MLQYVLEVGLASAFTKSSSALTDESSNEFEYAETSRIALVHINTAT